MLFFLDFTSESLNLYIYKLHFWREITIIINNIFKLSKLFLVGAIIALIVTPSFAQETPKDATQSTKAANAKLLEQLPFSDNASFEAAKKGFIAPLPDNGVIKNEKGVPIWDLSKFAFIKEGEPAPDSVNPSLWRQSQLITQGGLFEVVPGIYQVRAADLSNITFIVGNDGIIVMDPLISAETAKSRA